MKVKEGSEKVGLKLNIQKDKKERKKKEKETTTTTKLNIQKTKIMVKCLPTMQETWVRSLCQEDPLEKEMATHSSTLAWKIPWTEEHGRLLQSMGWQSVRQD